MVALLAAILETATVDYELLSANPLRSILRRRNFADFRPQERRVRILEPEDFRRPVAELRPPVLQVVLFASLSGCRWSEQVALRIEEDVKYIAQQAGHASAGFTLDRYGHLFETITPTHAE